MTARPTTPAVLGALTSADGWVPRDWIVEATGLRTDQVESALARLIKEGKARKTGSRATRTYRLADGADAQVAEAVEEAVDVPASTLDVAIWTSGSIVIEKDGAQLALTAAEADQLIAVLQAAQPVRDEFVNIQQAAATAVAQSEVAA